ncbi:MAG: NHL repeat-containing protein [Fibrobacterota bacterium]
MRLSPPVFFLTLMVLVPWKAIAAPNPPYPTTLIFPPYFHSYGIQRASQAKLAMLLPFTTEFDDPQGIAVTKMIARDDTATDEDDDEVTVYGVNSGKGELIYNTSMYGISVWGKKGSGREEMKEPRGVACDPQGNVFICDAGNDRIVRLFNPKRKVYFVKHLGDGALLRPTHIALDGDGLLYVSDSGHHRILLMDRDGRVRREIIRAGSIPVASPSGIALNLRNERYLTHRSRKGASDLDNTLCHVRKDYLFFLNNSGCALVRLNLEDNTAISIRFDGTSKKPLVYEYLASDYYGNLYLPDRTRGTIDIYDIELRYLTSFGKSGTGNREFCDPRGICIWKWYGQTFVSEKTGAQYYWIGTDFSNLKVVEKSSGRFDFSGRLTEPSYLTLNLLQGNDIVQTFFSKTKAYPGKFSYPLTPAVKGADRLLFTAEPVYSSYKVFKKTDTLKLP